MKVIKKTISTVLAIIIAFSSAVTVFAAEDNNPELNGTEYRYYGELTEGWTEVCEDGWDIKDIYAYYTFNASSDGYYVFSYGTPHTSMWAGVYNVESGCTEPDYVETVYDYFAVDKIYYLEKGKYNFVVDIYSSAEEVNIYSEFLGEEITDITFNYDQLLDYDLFWWGSEGNRSFESYADATITFSSGKTYEFSNGVLEGTADSEPVDGKNNVRVDFLDKKIASTVTVYPVSYFVSDVELSNAEHYLENAVEFYNDLEKKYPYGETVTVTFTDGTTQTVEYSTFQKYITLPNGQDYEFDIYYYTNSSFFSRNTYQMKICLGYNCVMREYEVNGIKATFIENIKLMQENNKFYSDEMFNNIGPMLSSVGNKEDFMYYFGNVIINLLEIYVNCYDFFHYYTAVSFV